MPIALDATYSLGKNLTGVGVYSRELLWGLARSHPEEEFLFCYRPNRFVRSYGASLPKNAVRRLLVGTPPGDIFHALNQRVDAKARRTISTFHDLFVMSGEYSSPEFRERFTLQAKHAAERSDLIVTVSQFTAGQVEKLLGFPAARIRVIPHGVKMPAASHARRENIVLFVGVIQRRKNIARLVKAFEALPTDWKLILAGDPNGYGAEAEHRAIAGSPRHSQIEVLGRVTNTQLESLYRRARIFAFPSLDEGFGIPVLEAMGHGIPVVTSNCSGMPDAAGDAALLVNPKDTDELASALLRLAEDQTLRDDLIRRGLERARSFSWDAAVERTWAVYKELR